MILHGWDWEFAEKAMLQDLQCSCDWGSVSSVLSSCGFEKNTGMWHNQTTQYIKSTGVHESQVYEWGLLQPASPQKWTWNTEKSGQF